MARGLNAPRPDVREPPPPVLTLFASVSLAGLLYVWAGYPLIIRALAALKRRRVAVPPRSRGPRTVSIIIASRDDAAAIERRVADCLRTTYPPDQLEIVVGIDASVGGELPELFTGCCRIRVVRGDGPGGKAATLNAAVRAAGGDVLLFADAHQRFDADAIGGLVAALDAPGVGAASGCLDFPRGRAGASRSLAERYWLFERWLRRNEADVHSCIGVTGAIWAMRRELWSPLPAQLILDDLYTPMRLILAGHRVAFVHAARAMETRRHAPRQEYHRKVRTLTGVMQMCAWLPQTLHPVRNPVWAQWVTHKLLRLLTPYWIATIVLWLGVYVGLALGARALWVVVAAAAVSAVARVALPRVTAVAWETLVAGVLLQTAAIVGTVNGVRRRWDVWRA
jgi:cellulose synthase/poly-beta-1,6-N-acetylglucosamine synthase-like glycosyltransferase